MSVITLLDTVSYEDAQYQTFGTFTRSSPYHPLSSTYALRCPRATIAGHRAS